MTNEIQFIRGKKVLLDFQLSEVYQVEIKRLNQQVNRNLNRFPEDFMFQLRKEEWNALRLQLATSKGGRRYLPYAFTEHGAVMLASVLNSEVAIQASIFVVRLLCTSGNIWMPTRNSPKSWMNCKPNTTTSFRWFSMPSKA